MTTNNELLPCPFCGGKASFERQGTHSQSCIVVCDSCGCRHESGYEYEFSADGWNTRKPAMPEDSEDAARYRWLRNESLGKAFGDGVMAPVVFNCDDGFQHTDIDHLQGKELDAAIDAARAAKEVDHG